MKVCDMRLSGIGKRPITESDPEALPECRELCETCRYFADNYCTGNGYEEKEREEQV